MMIQIPAVLSKAQVAELRTRIDAAEWIDGNATSGFQAAMAKNNQQLPQDGAAAREVGAIVVQALQANPLFVSAALPRTILPPLFNRYGVGMGFADHVDNAIRRDPSTGQPLRTDMSITVFLSDPDDYDGGELVVEDAYGSHLVKLTAGSAILYPASSLHHVTQVTRGVRTASFFWIQSHVRDDAARATLFDMDMALQGLRGQLGDDHASLVSLTGVYQASSWTALVAATGVILSAIYALSLYRRVVFGEMTNPALAHITDLDWREIAIFVPLIASTLYLGFQPDIIFNITGASVDALVAAWRGAGG